MNWIKRVTKEFISKMRLWLLLQDISKVKKRGERKINGF